MMEIPYYQIKLLFKYFLFIYFTSIAETGADPQLEVATRDQV